MYVYSRVREMKKTRLGTHVLVTVLRLVSNYISTYVDILESPKINFFSLSFTSKRIFVLFISIYIKKRFWLSHLEKLFVYIE